MKAISDIIMTSDALGAEPKNLTLVVSGTRDGRNRTVQVYRVGVVVPTMVTYVLHSKQECCQAWVLMVGWARTRSQIDFNASADHTTAELCHSRSSLLVASCNPHRFMPPSHCHKCIKYICIKVAQVGGVLVVQAVKQ